MMKKVLWLLIVGLMLVFSRARAQTLVYANDFESGYSGYTDYTLYGGSGDMGDTQFSISLSPNNVHSGFLSFGDHTSGDGNMMVVNAAIVADQYFFGSDGFVPLNQGIYDFSFWGRSALGPDPSPGEVQFTLWNDTSGSALQVLGSSVLAADGNAGWNQYSVQWINSSGITDTLSLRLSSVNLDGGGNDFAVDDIAFVVVPEPNSLVLAVILLGAMLTARGARKKKSGR